ncbi:hypothetical protein OESDEN_11981 [Oesophagostomum dentatum]|uniref:Uncharacterized protein n=1 Tax=Oesophagostomum dentatum TaxID=61180 RepID=A0A0B1SYI7_OESDE|nr:hypothetical protein OESDEN_11981 [Oesophagostomum dentatum]
MQILSKTQYKNGVHDSLIQEGLKNVARVDSCRPPAPFTTT